MWAMVKVVLILSFLFSCNQVLAETQSTISGHIRDAETGEELIGTTIYIESLKSGTQTNVYGFYSLSVLSGIYNVKIGMIGYETNEFEIDLTKDIRRDFELRVKPIEIAATVVTAERTDGNIRLTEMSSIKINPTLLSPVPVLFGEQDILKTIQLLPGIQSAGEGNSGFYVRGGGADQNLILLDEAIVYNASHLLGFFSVFNSDAIKDVKLIKGVGSAEYGGRLSSVLDMKMKEGNSRDYKLAAGIGLIASRILAEGPIKKDVGSFVISGRRTYADLFLKASSNEDVKNSKLYFYDLNAKANYRLNKNDRLFVSAYLGRDVLGYKGEFGIDWGNTTATVRLNHIFSKKLFSNSSLIYSLYNYKIGIINGDELINLKSSIKNFSIKEGFEYFKDSKNTFKFGINSVYHAFLPGEIEVSDQSSVNELEIKKKYAWENSFYLNHEHEFSSLFSLNYGLRYSIFSVLGPAEVFEFTPDGDVLDSKQYSRNAFIKTYGGLEPRITANYLIDHNKSVKLSYARNRQYLHLLSTSTTTTPFDVWHPSTKIVKPGIADQYGIGYFHNFQDNKYETSAEIYYKNLSNQVDYKNGANVYFNELVESELVFGKARSYGLELYASKTTGRLTGWISYTLSKTEKKFSLINNGDWFKARQDRRHDISAVGIYNLNRFWTISSSWVYYTGNAVTFPSGKYIVDEHIINLYTERNGYRMPNYHRLDLGLTWHGDKSSWNFSLYNAYGRKNAYAIDFRQNEDDPSKTEAVKIALFSFFPSITYNIKF